MLATIITLALTGLESIPGVERVELVCNPKSGTARVLESAAPNDLHPDWRGKDRIGIGWGLFAHSRVHDRDGVAYLTGEIVSPRGSIITARAFVLEYEWDCRVQD